MSASHLGLPRVGRNNLFQWPCRLFRKGILGQSGFSRRSIERGSVSLRKNLFTVLPQRLAFEDLLQFQSLRHDGSLPRLAALARLVVPFQPMRYENYEPAQDLT